MQIHAVHTVSQGALQNTDTIPVKFPNILPKQIRIKDIVIHGVGKRAQFSRYITFEIWSVITNKFEKQIAQVIRYVFQIGRHKSKGWRETFGRLVEIFFLPFLVAAIKVFQEFVKDFLLRLSRSAAQRPPWFLRSPSVPSPFSERNSKNKTLDKKNKWQEWNKRIGIAMWGKWERSTIVQWDWSGD